MIFRRLFRPRADAKRRSRTSASRKSRDYARLEDRVVFSGTPAGEVDLVDVEFGDISDSLWNHDHAVSDSDTWNSSSIIPVDELLEMAMPPMRREIVFIDEAVEGSAALLDDLLSAEPSETRITEAFMLSADGDGVNQISKALASLDEVDAIHIVSHSSDGDVQLGNASLDESSLSFYAGRVASWGNALTEGGDILIYGCNLANGSLGTGLVESIGELTQADVAASDNVTGHYDLGGDWQLEFAVGMVETTTVFSDALQQDWLATLDVFAVSTAVDGGAGSLRAAIDQANLAPGIDEIVLPAGDYDISGLGELDILDDLIIRGANADDTTIDAFGASRVFDIDQPVSIHISGITIQGGNANDGGGIRVVAGADLTLERVVVQGNQANNGAGIFSDGLLNFTDVEIRNNVATTDGGGINHTAIATLNRVTLAGNSADDGGGIYSNAVATGSNTTFSANTAVSRGGAIFARDNVTFTNATIVANRASNGFGAAGYSQAGGAVFVGDSIINSNFGGNWFAFVGDLGDNFDDDGLVGTTADPLLDYTLTNNGGFTRTHAILPGSPAIDGDTNGDGQATDQRNYFRSGAADIGAFESLNRLTVTNTLDDGSVGSLRWAITQANSALFPGLDLIDFDIPGAGPHTITIGGSALPSINEELIIDASTEPDFAGMPVVEIDGNGLAADGLFINTDNTIIRGVVVNNFGSNGILVSGSGNRVEDSFLGTNQSGTAAAGNAADGIVLAGNDNVVSNSVISGNGQHGIEIQAGSFGNSITGNLIGVDRTGTIDLGNSSNGIRLTGASNNRIGGTVPLSRNVISGNNDSGIRLNANSNSNQIQGNLIGTDWSGLVGLGNGNSANDEGIYVVDSANNTIGGTLDEARNVISDNAGDGIGIQGAGSTGNTIQRNYIGTDANGTAGLGNTWNGVWIGNGAQDNLVGGAGHGNVVSGNGDDGVEVQGPTTSGNRIEGNLIGLDADGTNAIGNASDGVWLENAPNNIVGGVAPNSRNVISGNAASGVHIAFSGATGNVVQNNYIGTNANGDGPIANGGDGVLINDSDPSENTGSGGADGNFVGVNGIGNVISGNANHGVRIANSDGNSVVANIVGLDASGDSPISNSLDGIHLNGAANTQLGGTVAGDGNVVSGNLDDGIGIRGSTSTNTLVFGNLIGTDATGLIDRANAEFGIVMRSGASDNTIGGVGANEANTIAYNGLGGVGIFDQLGTEQGHTIRGNSIHDNVQLGIDLNADGVTLNESGDADAGANDLQNYPVITSVSFNAGSVTIVGSLASFGPDTFDIDIYTNLTADASGYGEGQTYLGSTSVSTTGISAQGFSTTFAYFGGTDVHVAATATSQSTGNTSEFSRAMTSSAGNTLLFSTLGNGSQPDGSRNLTNWTNDQAIELFGPSLVLDPALTEGSFRSLIDLAGFGSGPVGIDALHYVQANIVIGNSSTVALQSGDLLLSIDDSVSSVTLTSNNALTVQGRDVFAFRPTSSGDYSSGTFTMLLNDFGGDGNDDVHAITLVEEDTVVGDTLVRAGTFLFADAENDVDIRHFTPDVVGSAVATGTKSLFLDGAALNFSPPTMGLELIENNLTLGDEMLSSGSLLVTLDDFDNDITGALTAQKQDVFALDVSSTEWTLGSTAIARLLLDGGDIDLDAPDDNENIQAISVIASILDPNNDPLGVDDGFVVAENGTLNDDTLANDPAEPDGDARTVYLVNGPANASMFALNPDGTFTYIHDGDEFVTSDTFDYAVSDGKGGITFSTATVSIGLVNDPPIVTTSSGALTFTENDPPQTIDGGLSLSDADDSSLTGATVSISAGFEAGQDQLLFTDQLGIAGSYNAASGVLTLSGSASIVDYEAAMRTVAYQTASENPSETTRTLSFVVDDGNDVSLAAMRDMNVVAVNDPPTNSVPGTQSVNEDTTLVFDAAGSNLVSVADPDLGSGLVEVMLNATNGTVTLNGTSGLVFTLGDGIADPFVTFQGTLADVNTALNGLTFDPTSGFAGAASLQMVTDDLGNTGLPGAQSDVDIVDINVGSTNDPPVNSVPGAQSVNQGSALVFDLAGSNLISISDIDAGGNPVELTLAATNGTMTLSGTMGLTFSTGDGTADGTMTFQGTIPDINTAVDSLTFDPTPGFSGSAMLQITTNDLGNSGAGGIMIDTDTVNILVVATSSEEVLTNNNLLTVAEGASGGITDLLLLTIDADNSAVELIYTVTNPPSVGRLEFANTPGMSIGSFTQQDIDNDLLRYAHDGSESTLDSFGFNVDDGTGTATTNQVFNISILPVNDAPTLTVPGTQFTSELIPVSFGPGTGNAVVIADVDAVGSVAQLTVSVVNGVVDLSGSGLVFVTGDGVGDPIVVVQGTIPNLQAALNGLLFRPASGFVGTTNVQLVVNDLGSSGVGGPAVASGSISVEVVGAPRANDDAFSVAPGAAVGGNVVLNDSWSSPSVTTSLVTGTTNGVLVWNGDGTFSYTANSGFFGIDTFTYQLNDALGSDVASVVLNVIAPIPSTSPTPVNDPDEDGDDADDSDDPIHPGAPLIENDDVIDADKPRALNRRQHDPRPGVVGDEDAAAKVTVLVEPDGSDRNSRRYSGQSQNTYDRDFNVVSHAAPLLGHMDPFQINIGAYFGRLDAIREELMASASQNTWNVQPVLAASGGISIGWVLWTVRGSYLVASLLSYASPWMLVDPLPVLDSLDKDRRKDRARADEDKLEEMLD